MDVELLSKMVGELIAGHDKVGLPGVGTFVAELMPASFSDKGYTINPPYRRLTFSSECSEDQLLSDFYAASNGISRESARSYITQFLAELKTILSERKTVGLPGLGRLRATRENAVFFVPEENLDIYPEGFALEPVSLKTHSAPIYDDIEIFVPVPVPEPEKSPAEAETSGSLETTEAATLPETAEVQETSAVKEPEAVGEETVVVSEETPDEPQPDAPVKVEETVKTQETVKRKGWLIALLTVLAVALVALAVFMILARVAPDFIDSILYTPEELRIINY